MISLTFTNCEILEDNSAVSNLVVSRVGDKPLDIDTNATIGGDGILMAMDQCKVFQSKWNDQKPSAVSSTNYAREGLTGRSIWQTEEAAVGNHCGSAWMSA